MTVSDTCAPRAPAQHTHSTLVGLLPNTGDFSRPQNAKREHAPKIFSRCAGGGSALCTPALRRDLVALASSGAQIIALCEVGVHGRGLCDLSWGILPEEVFEPLSSWTVSRYKNYVLLHREMAVAVGGGEDTTLAVVATSRDVTPAAVGRREEAAEAIADSGRACHQQEPNQSIN